MLCEGAASGAASAAAAVGGAGAAAASAAMVAAQEASVAALEASAAGAEGAAAVKEAWVAVEAAAEDAAAVSEASVADGAAAEVGEEAEASAAVVQAQQNRRRLALLRTMRRAGAKPQSRQGSQQNTRAGGAHVVLPAVYGWKKKTQRQAAVAKPRRYVAKPRDASLRTQHVRAQYTALTRHVTRVLQRCAAPAEEALDAPNGALLAPPLHTVTTDRRACVGDSLGSKRILRAANEVPTAHTRRYGDRAALEGRAFAGAHSSAAA